MLCSLASVLEFVDVFSFVACMLVTCSFVALLCVHTAVCVLWCSLASTLEIVDVYSFVACLLVALLLVHTAVCCTSYQLARARALAFSL